MSARHHQPLFSAYRHRRHGHARLYADPRRQRPREGKDPGSDRRRSRQRTQRHPGHPAHVQGDRSGLATRHPGRHPCDERARLCPDATPLQRRQRSEPHHAREGRRQHQRDLCPPLARTRALSVRVPDRPAYRQLRAHQLLLHPRQPQRPGQRRTGLSAKCADHRQ